MTPNGWAELTCGHRVRALDPDSNSLLACARCGPRSLHRWWPDDDRVPRERADLAYTIVVTCPRCGAPMRHAADGKPTTIRAGAAIKCTARQCSRGALIVVQLMDGAA